MKRIVNSCVALAAAVFLAGGPAASADTWLSLELPELTGTFTHGQAPISAVFDFGQPFVWGPEAFIEITGTGTPGTTSTGGTFDADLLVSVYFLEGPLATHYPQVFGPYGETPITWVTDIPGELTGDFDMDGGDPVPGASGKLLVVIDSNPAYTDVVTPSTVNITNVTMTVLDEDPGYGCPCNCDGFVGLDDLDIILSNWNMNTPPADPCADPSGDGYVGLEDLDIILTNWNAGTPPAVVVPEPGGVLCVLMGFCLLRRANG